MFINYSLARKVSGVNRYKNKQEHGLHVMGNGSGINEYTNRQEHGLCVMGKVKLDIRIFSRNSNTLVPQK